MPLTTSPMPLTTQQVGHAGNFWGIFKYRSPVCLFRMTQALLSPIIPCVPTCHLILHFDKSMVLLPLVFHYCVQTEDEGLNSTVFFFQELFY